MKEINGCRITQDEQSVKITSPKIILTYHLEKGEYDLLFLDSPYPQIKKIGYSFRYGNQIYTSDMIKETVSKAEIHELSDSFGSGLQLAVIRTWGLLKITQTFRIIPKHSWLLISCSLESEDFIESNYISPMVCNGDVFSLKDTKTPRLLYVPFDNDKWIRYKSQRMEECGGSYEVTAIYDDDSRNGYVIGSVSHDQWKTGIKTHGGHGSISHLTIYGGAADPVTRDEAMPHGAVRGKKISSPIIFTGYDTDFREGLIEYGHANHLYKNRLPFHSGVPFGWNSWACVTTDINYEIYAKASETIHELKPLGFHNNGTAYINFDSFWNNLSEQEIKASVSLAHSRGQKAGTYYTPFACWTNNFDQLVEGTDGMYTYRDILARDNYGNILPPIAGGYPIDPTHPGNLMRVESMMRYIVDMGFDYLKLDFLSHGSCECVHYLPEITTGIEGYCYGLNHMYSFLKPEQTGREIFINLSIAPIFPYHFAHARRISCDVFGQIEDTEYMLNSLTYGFWQNNQIYEYTDPDHTCLYKSVGRPISEFYEARARLHASVIAGTLLLLSDDYRNKDAAERTRELLTPELMEIARKGKAFLPMDTNTGDGASSVFYLKEDNRMYLAVFNFNRSQNVIRFHESRLNLSGQNLIFNALDKSCTIHGPNYEVPLQPMESIIFVSDNSIE